MNLKKYKNIFKILKSVLLRDHLAQPLFIRCLITLLIKKPTRDKKGEGRRVTSDQVSKIWGIR